MKVGHWRSSSFIFELESLTSVPWVYVRLECSTYRCGLFKLKREPDLEVIRTRPGNHPSILMFSSSSPRADRRGRRSGLPKQRGQRLDGGNSNGCGFKRRQGVRDKLGFGECSTQRLRASSYIAVARIDSQGVLCVRFEFGCAPSARVYWALRSFQSV
ncbi:hypothetical protein K439DRAFT_1617683 [Ramaria rubella]|nr:hypothetical protein K439DRAFT_1617683 [Ramaria rubella]